LVISVNIGVKIVKETLLLESIRNCTKKLNLKLNYNFGVSLIINA